MFSRLFLFSYAAYGLRTSVEAVLLVCFLFIHDSFICFCFYTASISATLWFIRIDFFKHMEIVTLSVITGIELLDAYFIGGVLILLVRSRSSHIVYRDKHSLALFDLVSIHCWIDHDS